MGETEKRGGETKILRWGGGGGGGGGGSKLGQGMGAIKRGG